MQARSAALSVEGLRKRFGEVAALDGVSLDIASGELLTILGPSGSGKTTLLKVVAGFEKPDAGVVRRGGEEVHCTRTELRLLCELARHPGKVLSREHLLEQVWGYDYFGDGRLVDVHVRRLRTKVEPDPASPRFILTVRGMGYKLAV